MSAEDSLDNAQFQKNKCVGNELDETDQTKFYCIYGIASAMHSLHANNVLHRDLRPENILMDDHFYPKIEDFSKKETSKK